MKFNYKNLTVWLETFVLFCAFMLFYVYAFDTDQQIAFYFPLFKKAAIFTTVIDIFLHISKRIYLGFKAN